MGMGIRTNMMGMFAYRQFAMNTRLLGRSMERLASGYRINRAADDPSGLAISEKMRAQIAGLNQAAANAQDGISLIQTAEGATDQIHAMLTRMVELATKAANGTLQNDVDRQAIQQEIDDLTDEISRIAKASDFNGIKLLDGNLSGGIISAMATTGGVTVRGEQANALKATYFAKATITFSADMEIGDTLTIDGKTYTMAGAGADAAKGEFTDFAGLQTIIEAGGEHTVTGGIDAANPLVITSTKQGGGLRLQIGDTNDDFNKAVVNIENLTAQGLGLGDLNVMDETSAGEAIDVIKAAINKVSLTRARLGSQQNRLEYTIENLETTAQNLSEADSRIRDTNMAQEMMNYTRLSIVTQVAQAMMAQANQQAYWILQLLRG